MKANKISIFAIALMLMAMGAGTALANSLTEVDVDIKPGSFPNSINLNPRSNTNGVIPVAILSTATFDASTVDYTTLEFGPAGASALRASLEDVDGDGDLDLVAHFRIIDTGIAPGDTEATLTGETIYGTNIYGTDSVRTIPDTP